MKSFPFSQYCCASLVWLFLTVCFAGNLICQEMVIESITAYTGATVTVPVHLQNVSDVGGVAFEINYDGAQLTLMDTPSLGTLTSGALFATNPENFPSSSGIFKFSLVQASGISGTGTFLELPFRVALDAEGAIPITVQSVSVIDTDIADIAIDTTDGSISVRAQPGILIVRTFGPVDLVVTDPRARTIDKNSSTIPNATYTEEDLNGDSELDDEVVIPDVLSGPYLIQVIPEPGAALTDTFTLEVIFGGQTTTVAEDVQIQDIPPEPYGYGVSNCYVDAGWSLFSFSINKCFYEGTPPTNQPACVELVDVVNDLGFGSMADWFDSILASDNVVDNPWRIVIGTNGAMDSTLSPSSHSLKYMSSCSGYWVKIEDAAGGATLSLFGSPFARDCAIPMLDGWSMTSYPLSAGYYDTDTPPDIPEVANWTQVPRPVAAYVFASIADKYRIIIGQQGVYDPNLSPSSSSLRYVAPGNAFWIKMDEPWDLVYSGMGTASPALATPSINQAMTISGVTRTTTSALVYGGVAQDGVAVDAGSRIQVFSQEGVLCGESTITHSGQYGMTLIYGDDPYTPQVDGARTDEQLTFYVDGKPAQTEGDIYWPGDKAIQRVSLTVIRRPGKSGLGQNYPNPFNPETWIPYQLKEDVHVVIRIYTATGQLVRTLNLGHKPAGFHSGKLKAAHWDGENEAGEMVASGVYFYAIQAGEFSVTKKMVMLK